MTAELPSLDSHYTVADDTVSSYAADGHAVVRGLASREEIGVYGPIISDAALSKSTENRPLEQRETYGKAFLQVINLWEHDARVARFVMAERFAKVAADLMGVEGVRLYHDQALFKEAGGGYTPFHQDQPYWPLEDAKTITMWMPLVDVTPEMGTMSFVSGSHCLRDLGTFGISDESEQVFNAWVSERDLSVADHGAMSAGDATFHSGWMLHRANPNTTDRLRAVMTVIYVADKTRVAKASDKNAGDMRFLGGREAGDLVDSVMNPLLFIR